MKTLQEYKFYKESPLSLQKRLETKADLEEKVTMKTALLEAFDIIDSFYNEKGEILDQHKEEYQLLLKYINKYTHKAK
ncbi:hypothetical protein COE51_01230 [Bacillus pseudomycoides]|nr:hypothetical protein COE51_01230 [Bacillus pseudomycoides]